MFVRLYNTLKGTGSFVPQIVNRDRPFIRTSFDLKEKALDRTGETLAVNTKRIAGLDQDCLLYTSRCV